MLPTRLLNCCVLAAIVGGCGADDFSSDTDRIDDDGSASCALPEYGDGTCNTDLACEAPDIDCFLLFETDAAAAEWFAAFEKVLAEEELRPPRAVIPESDPRSQRMRELLDRGWEAYKATNNVADLAESRPGLVVLEDPTVNAFVAPDLESGNAGFAVMVQTGLLDLEAPDGEMLGLVMHELQHAVGLHIVGDVRDRMRKFYVADYGEPFGFEQDDNPVAHEHGQRWRDLATEVGSFAYPELRGLPMGGSQIDQVFTRVVEPVAEQENCTASIAALNELRAEIVATLSPLEGTLALPEDASERADAVMAQLRDECMPDLTKTFIEIIAEMAGITPEQAKKTLSEEDLALVENKHVLDAIGAMMIDRRGKMTEIEQAFATTTGVPWTSLRYYSTEEAADDATVPVLEAAELPLDGLGDFLLRVFDDVGRAACVDVLDAGDVPPYGADLADEHHATCWRTDHVRRVAESGVLSGEKPGGKPGGDTSYRRIAPRSRRLPIPPRYRDLIMY